MTPRALRIRLTRLPHAQDLPLPEPATSGASGLDLRAAVDDSRELSPGERLLVPTGLVLHIPPGWEGQIRPRSGLALESGVTVANAPGTVDSDYRGEVGVLLVNLGTQPRRIERGERIAQLVIAPVARVQWQETEELGSVTIGRGSGGFGSTGRK